MFIDPLNATRYCRAPTPSERDIILTSNPEDVIIASGGASNLVIEDRIYDHHETATIDHNIAVYTDDLEPGTWQNLTPDTIDFDPNTLVAAVKITDGIIRTGSILRKSLGISKRVDFPISREIGISYDELIGFTSGTLGEHIWTGLTNILNASQSFNISAPIYSVRTQSAFTLNPNRWLTDDLSGVAGYSGFELPWTPTKVHEQLIIFAKHYRVGGITFRSNTGVIYDPLIEFFDVPNLDICVGKLSFPLPATVKSYKVFTNAALAKISNSGFGIPIIHINQLRKASVSQLNASLSNNPHITVPTNSLFASFYEEGLPGDSGSPFFIRANNELNLAGLFSMSIQTFLDAKAAINTQMNLAIPGAALQEINVDAFP